MNIDRNGNIIIKSRLTGLVAIESKDQILVGEGLGTHKYGKHKTHMTKQLWSGRREDMKSAVTNILGA